MPSSLKTLNQYANIIAGEPEEAKLKRLNTDKISYVNKNFNSSELKEKNNFEFLFDNDEKKDHNQTNQVLNEILKVEKFLDENKEENKEENKLELKDEILKEKIINVKEETKVINSKPISTNLSRKKKT